MRRQSGSLSILASLAIVAVLTACGSPDSTRSTRPVKGSARTTVAQQPLTVGYTEYPLVCDGKKRTVGTLSGAQPGEPITISVSPAGPNFAAGRADKDGSLALSILCPAKKAAKRTHVARGTKSGRMLTFVYESVEKSTAPTPLTIKLVVDRITCDGRPVPIGAVEGAAPGEAIRLVGSYVPYIPPTGADAAGVAPLAASCRLDEEGLGSFEATGAMSGRKGRFSIGAVRPEPTPLRVELSGNLPPCDNQPHSIGRVSGGVPGDTIIVFPGTRDLVFSRGFVDGSGSSDLVMSCVPGASGTWTVLVESRANRKARFSLTIP